MPAPEGGLRAAMEIVTSVAAVRERVRGWHREGRRIAFVPTMGNLHAGHMSLIEAAARHGERFVASIFVNPMQFGPNEDFAHYPRTPGVDERMLAAAGCHLMFQPDVAEIYPRGFEQSVRIDVPGLTRILCGEFRPGHFEGVATVVTKLFNIVEPDMAVFGEKDYQQLTIIRRMAADLLMPVEIIGAPTVREPDGLAMSSRNQYLTPTERRIAPRLFEELGRAAARLREGHSDFSSIEAAAMDALRGVGFSPEYFSIRARDLSLPQHELRELVVLTAARLGRARLIDNVQLVR
ncbi:MAG: pantoate--beta-alanine ligase [Steroidobacteraceae bacterium]